ncbi:glucosyltransferase domain-containing protein [Microvirga lenta]|uniref:glucosyltransferase domain-containing protein n=1 Tax=Microvirga lenta TaxID=2881337 RepID=UPI001CFF7ED3|nr:glucosyltransferase domain-containing protein [Microvirga lenta]MCB5175205.1 glucosyltransferase domain-containing protein [Microvirga lenta]
MILSAEKVSLASHLMWQRYYRPLLGVIILGFIARGQAILAPLYSIDTYHAAYVKEAAASYDFLLSQGRYGWAILWWLRDTIGVHGVEVTSAGMILSVVMLAVTGFLFAVAILKEPTPAEAFLFAAIFTLHPFNTEFFHFSNVTSDITFAILLSALGMAAAFYISSVQLAAFVSVPLIVASLGIYQLAAAHIGTVWLLATAARLIENRSGAAALKYRLERPLQVLLIIAICLAILAVSLVLIRFVVDIPLDGRADLSKLLDVRVKVQALGTAVGMALWPSPGLVPRSIAVLLIAVLSFCFCKIVWQGLRTRRYVLAIGSAILLSLALAWSAGASVMSGVIWLVPRVISPISVFIAGAVLLAWHSSSKPTRMMIGVSVCVICVSYIGASNRILFDQRRLNLWDAQQANRIIARLEMLPQFTQMSSVAVVGGHWARSSRLSTAIGDMNVSALAVSWAKIGLLEQATGYHFAEPTPAELDKAQVYCASSPSWPASESVTIIDKLGVVCLTTPKS